MPVSDVGAVVARIQKTRVCLNKSCVFNVHERVWWVRYALVRANIRAREHGPRRTTTCDCGSEITGIGGFNTTCVQRAHVLNSMFG